MDIKVSENQTEVEPKTGIVTQGMKGPDCLNFLYL